MSEAATILIVDDQESAREFLGRYLEVGGYRVRLCEGVECAMREVESGEIDLVITDLKMPGIDGLEGLERIRARDPSLPVIMVTAYATVETAVEAMRLGAFDYVRKPFEPEEMELVVERAVEHRRLVEENRKLKAEIAGRYRLDNIVGKSPPMEKLFAMIHRVAPVDVPVLITGESGTGKDLVARALHGLSPRAQGTFLSINCAAVHESLLESELFGHERGAFSGAERARPGYFREADGGTLFLDEIGDLGIGQQAKLLRVLESGELIPVGAEHPVQVNVRVLAATHRNLEQMVEDGEFRADLLFRIDTMRLHLPPLRDRIEDIEPLTAAFLTGRDRDVRLSGAAMNALLDYPWPGNVRELRHAIDHALLVADGAQILPEHLPQRVRGKSSDGVAAPSWAEGSYRDAKRAFERAYFEDLLSRTGGNISRAARVAGIHRATFHEKLKKLGLSGVREDEE